MAAQVIDIQTLRDRRFGRREEQAPSPSPAMAVDAAWEMLEAGEVKPREFLELCWEALSR